MKTVEFSGINFEIMYENVDPDDLWGSKNPVK